MTYRVFRPRTGWFSYAMLIFAVVIVLVTAISLPWWAVALCGSCVVGVVVLTLFGTWYAVADGCLIVYMFCLPRRFPISRISEVRFTGGFLSLGAPSGERLSIRFSGHRPINGFSPLEVAPRDKESFVEALLEVNPGIRVVDDTDV